MRQESLEQALQKPMSRRETLRLGLGLASLLVLEACGGSSKKSGELDCLEGEFSVGQQPIETPSEVQIKPEQILSAKELESLNVKVFNFSHFPGEMKFTQSFASLLEPLTKRGAKLRIIFVDDSPNRAELKQPPLNNLKFFTDGEIVSNKNVINKLRPNTIAIITEINDNNIPTPLAGFETGCYIDTIIIELVDTDADHGGFAGVYYKPKSGFLAKLRERFQDTGDTAPIVNNPQNYTPIMTIVVGVKDIQLGYEDLRLNNYRTVPVQDSLEESILNRFLHEIKHTQDFAGYVNELDRRFFSDFNGSLPYKERPGEKRAIEFAEEEIKKIQDGKLPPIVIYDDKGKMLKINISSTAA